MQEPVQNPELDALSVLVGEWAIEAKHPACVHRVYRVGLSDGTLRIWRDAPGFSQRFAGTVGGDGQTISGLWELSRDDGSTWDDDLEIEFRRIPE